MEKEKQLTKEELEKVNGGGGYTITTVNGKHYTYIGTDESKKYKCPNCGRPLHPGSWDRFYCDPCNNSWWYEKVLPANINSGAWREMTEEEYRQYKVDTSWAEKGTKAG